MSKNSERNANAGTMEWVIINALQFRTQKLMPQEFFMPPWLYINRSTMNVALETSSKRTTRETQLKTETSWLLCRQHKGSVHGSSHIYHFVAM